MKKIMTALGLIIFSVNATAYTQGAENVIKTLDKPFTITHLGNLNVDCVWTKDEKGYLNNENGGNEGTGVCWDTKAVDQVNALDKEGKLTWHTPAQHSKPTQYNEAATLLLSDKISAEVNGCIFTQMKLDAELPKIQKKYQKYPIEFSRGVKLGSYLKEIGDYDRLSCEQIIEQRMLH